LSGARRREPSAKLRSIPDALEGVEPGGAHDVLDGPEYKIGAGVWHCDGDLGGIIRREQRKELRVEIVDGC
jgi:hypothetical protein